MRPGGFGGDDLFAACRTAGVLLYGGTDVHWLTDRVIAVPWNRII